MLPGSLICQCMYVFLAQMFCVKLVKGPEPNIGQLPHWGECTSLYDLPWEAEPWVPEDQSECPFTYSTQYKPTSWVRLKLLSSVLTLYLILRAHSNSRLGWIFESSSVQFWSPSMIKFLLKPNELSPYLLHSKEEPYTSGSKHTPFLENKQLC